MNNERVLKLAIFTLIISSVLPILFLKTPVVKSAADHVVISEIQTTGGPGLANNEFVEIYNPTSAAVDVSSWKLTKKTVTGTETVLVEDIAPTLISSHGFILIAHVDYTDVSADTTYNAGVIADNNTILLYDADDTVVDKVGMGDANESETSAAQVPLVGRSIERKTNVTSTTESMESGGDDEFLGNGHDSNNNGNDFIRRTVSQPQNSSSDIEPVIATPTPTATPSETTSPTPTPTETSEPTDTPTPTPSDTPTPEPTDTPSPTPVDTPAPEGQYEIVCDPDYGINRVDEEFHFQFSATAYVNDIPLEDADLKGTLNTGTATPFNIEKTNFNGVADFTITILVGTISQTPVATVTFINQDVLGDASCNVNFSLSVPTPTPSPSDTPTPEPTDTPTPEPSDSPTPEPTDTPSPTPTPEPSESPSPTPEETPTPEPTETPEPTATPTMEPTPLPTPTAKSMVIGMFLFPSRKTVCTASYQFYGRGFMRFVFPRISCTRVI